MKKLILPLLMLFAISLSAQQLQQTANSGAAQPANTGIPDNVNVKFAWLYPDAGKPAWQIENGRYIAEFKNKGVETLSYFDKRGTHVLTKTAIGINELPAASASYIKENYPTASVESAIRSESNGSGTRYEAITTIQGKKSTFIFLADGGFFYKQDNKTK